MTAIAVDGRTVSDDRETLAPATSCVALFVSPHERRDGFWASIRGHVLDLADPNSGHALAPTPNDLYIVSIASELAWAARKILRAHGLPDDVSVSAKWQANADPPSPRQHQPHSHCVATGQDCGRLACRCLREHPRSARIHRAGCTHLVGRSEAMKPMISDKNLRDAVLKELEDDPEVVAKHISVTAIDGAITLGGHVMSIHEKHVAVRAAERVEAMRALADDIEVVEPSLHERADDEIAEEIAHLRSAGGPIPDSVAVEIRNGRVMLHGEIESASHREAAEDAVLLLAGVRVVDNLTTVRAQTEATADDVERRVREAIAQTADLHARSIEVTMNDSTAQLRGNLPSFAALQTVLRAAETAPGVKAVESEIVVES